MVKHATIHDVAQLCNVSVASVSRVLAKADYPVSDALRTRVLEAAAQLGYIPNAASRALKAHATNEVGVIIPNITNPCYAQLVKGIQDAAQMRGYHVLLYNSYRNPGQEAANIDMLLQKRVDGILIASISSDLSAIRRAMDVGCPVITMEQELNLPCIHVGYDYVRGGYLATEHLLLNGHRKIAFVGAPLDRPSRVQMLAGYRRCLREHGIAESPDYVLLSDSEQDAGDIYELRNGSRAADRFVAMENRPTACVCLNDITALGLMSALRKRGVKVPRDLSVVGFDNILYGEFSSPELTTVDQHAGEMGALAVRMLTEQIEEPDVVQYAVRLTPNLVERESVRRVDDEAGGRFPEESASRTLP